MDMKIIAIPIFGNRISPRLELATNLKLFEVAKRKVLNSEIIRLVSHNKLEKMNMIIGVKPDVIICDGLSKISEAEILKTNINLIPWVHGEVDTILHKYLTGTLKIKAKLKI